MRAILGNREFEWGSRVFLMGIVNTTPDSFSGDGLLDPKEAMANRYQYVRLAIADKPWAKPGRRAFPA